MSVKKTLSENLSPKELNKKYTSPFSRMSVLITAVLIVVIAYICLVYNLCPPGTIMRVGNFSVKEKDYLVIAENVSSEFGVNENDKYNENFYSSFYRDYISNEILLGMKAEEEGYSLTDIEKTELPKGKVYEYLALSKKIKDHTYNSISSPTEKEIKTFYNENKDIFNTGNYKLTFQIFEGTDEQLEELGEKAYRTKTMSAVEFYEKYGISEISFEEEMISTKNVLPAHIKNVSAEPIYRKYDNSTKEDIKKVIELTEYYDTISDYIQEEKNENPVKQF